MNESINITEKVQRLNKLAAEFAGPAARARSQNSLVPFADVIRALREKHASYALIAELLANEQICVSRFVVARFCRERLELEPRAEPKRRRAYRKRSAIENLPTPVIPPVAAPVPPPPSVPLIADAAFLRRNRGPRIADPSNL